MAKTSTQNYKQTKPSVGTSAVRARGQNPDILSPDQKNRSIRRWRIQIPVIYLCFILFFFLILSLCLASGSMFLIIFGPLLSIFCLISGPPLFIAFRRPDACYPSGHPPKPVSQRKLCLILLFTDLALVILLTVLWLIF